jgi:hypothetical protein
MSVSLHCENSAVLVSEPFCDLGNIHAGLDATSGKQPAQHHNVYVLLLDPAVSKIRKVRAENPKRDPKKLPVYVGMTGLTPKERFANHKQGIKSAAVSS